MASTFCAVPAPGLVYAGPRTKEEFDLIRLPETVHDWQADQVETLLHADGAQYERRCHSKVLGDHAPDGVTVIFQWFDFRVVASGVEP
ncbi:MAG: hypothetical protein ABS82_01155 [Rhodanobacter sp. SCN 67-45]|nr:MAG: hypothetical protein ABS82_01155 [Rhodanobacter sp. SCN 67-45]